MWYKYILTLTLLIPINIYAQVTIGSSSSTSSQEALLELSESMELLTDKELAKNYEELAKNLAYENTNDKAIIYYIKSRTINEKLENDAEVGRINREIGKLYEKLGKPQEALDSYSLAQNLLVDSISLIINTNDIKRLKADNIVEQEDAVNRNVELLKYIDDNEVKQDIYVQKATISLKKENSDEAIINLEKAKEVAENVQSHIEIQKQIVDVHMSTKDFQKAEEESLSILDQARKGNDLASEIKELETLASIYFKNNQIEKGYKKLDEAYQLGLKHNRVLDAKTSLQLLTEKYVEKKRINDALKSYKMFLDTLEHLVSGDSTLINAQIFKFNEARVEQLEKERELKDELIEKTNRFNYILIGSICIAVISLCFISKTLYTIKRKNKQIALQSLRREMNPHFIFNSLNSINQFIAQNNELEANRYLASYSKLMRNMMENSNKDFLPLSTEIEHLKEYLDLEHIRFSDKFDYTITVDNSIDKDVTLVPNMLIQPQLENAIWHGMRYKSTKGLIQIAITRKNNRIIIEINDDGIGLTKSKELKTKYQKKHISRGLKNTKERIALLNDLYKRDILCSINERIAPKTGVQVFISFLPLNK